MNIDSKKLDIVIETKGDFVMPFWIYDDNDQLVDLTGSTIEANLKQTEESTDYIPFTVTNNGKGGRITLTMPREVTSEISYSAGVYDVRVTFSDGTTAYPLFGDVKIRTSVSSPYAGKMIYLVAVKTFADLPDIGKPDRLYFTYDTNKIYRWNGSNYLETGFGNGIKNIVKKSTAGVTDTYRITFDNETYFDYNIVNGLGVTSVEYVDGGTYRMNFNDGTHLDFNSVPRIMGTYDATVAYQKLDIVRSSAGAVYIAKLPTTAGTDVTNTTYWQKLLSNLAIGTVTTVAADQGASASIGGTADAPVLNLSIPRGVTGNESIDDTKGEGDTDYVWSAGKSWKEFDYLEGYIADQINYNKNIYDGVCSNAFYSVSDGQTTGSNSKFVSGNNLIAVNQGDIIIFKTFPENFNNLYILFYKSDKTYLSYTTLTISNNKFTVPSNCGYFRIEFSFFDDTAASSTKRWIVYKNEQLYSRKLIESSRQNILDSFKNMFSNEFIYASFLESEKYSSGDTYISKELATLNLTSGGTYTLYVGSITGSVYNPCVRIYIKYSDDSVQRIDVTSGKFLQFTLKSLAISEQELRLLAVNSTTALSSGECNAHMIALAKGTMMLNNSIELGDDIPEYYRSHLATKEALIRDNYKNCSFNGDSMIFLTDTHYDAEYLCNGNVLSTTYNANHSIPLIENILKNTDIGFVMFGGDLVNSANGIDMILNSFAKFQMKMNKFNTMNCIGNHEYYTDLDDENAGRPTRSELYGGLQKNKETQYINRDAYNDYYFDNPLEKIRYFVISCGRDTEIETDQIEWMLNSLTEVPSNYRIIVIGHSFLSNDLSSFREGYSSIAEALDAITASESYIYNGNTYNYSALSNVEVVCIITGHSHQDGYLTSSGGTLCICTTCDSFAQQQGGITRSKGTVNEQAFDVIQFDFTNKKIYCTRIGYGSNREFTYTN